MKKNVCLIFSAISIFATSASAWDTPICFPNSAKKITITMDNIQGYVIDRAGDISISYRDNDGELEFESITRSPAFPDAHDVVFTRRQGTSGIVGVVMTHAGEKRSSTFELEFRDGSCKGAKITVE